MTRFICVTSGKGGVGKTTTAVNLASSLHQTGRDVLLVEGNISTPHIHLHLGSEGMDGCLHDAIYEKAHPARRIYRHSSGLRILPALTELNHLKYPHHEGFKHALMDLEGYAEIVILDSSPGFGREALVPMEVSDEVLIVTTPDHASLEDAKRTLEVASELGRYVLGVVVNMNRGDRYDEQVKDIENYLGVPVIAVVPEDKRVRSALKKRIPVVHAHPKSKSGKKFYELAETLIGPAYADKLKKEKSARDYLRT